MSTTTANTTTTTAFDDPPTPVRTKLAASWTSFMFLYIYVDYLTLYKPGVIDGIRDGVVFEFDISQTFVLSSLILISIPTFMILLSTTLPARASRVLNLVVASLFIPVTVFKIQRCTAPCVGLVGEAEYLSFYALGVVLELIVLAVILRSVWSWPRAANE